MDGVVALNEVVHLSKNLRYSTLSLKWILKNHVILLVEIF